MESACFNDTDPSSYKEDWNGSQGYTSKLKKCFAGKKIHRNIILELYTLNASKLPLLLKKTSLEFRRIHATLASKKVCTIYKTSIANRHKGSISSTNYDLNMFQFPRSSTLGDWICFFSPQCAKQTKSLKSP